MNELIKNAATILVAIDEPSSSILWSKRHSPKRYLLGSPQRDQDDLGIRQM
jgi:hypothetical protein